MGTIFFFNTVIYYCYNLVSFSHVNILILLFVLMLLSFLVLFSQVLIHLPRAALQQHDRETVRHVPSHARDTTVYRCRSSTQRSPGQDTYDASNADQRGRELADVVADSCVNIPSANSHKIPESVM